MVFTMWQHANQNMNLFLKNDPNSKGKLTIKIITGNMRQRQQLETDERASKFKATYTYKKKFTRRGQ